MSVARVAAALAALAATSAQADAPPCRVSTRLEPVSAVVGEQVQYRIRIASTEGVASIDWVQPPGFPGFRAEWLPGRPDVGTVEADGTRYRVREERRALFPQRAGELPVESPGLRCRVRGAREAYVAAVPPLQLDVAPAPSEGRPPGFDGPTGPLSVRLAVTPRSARLGGTVRVAVTLRGGGNVWDAPDPFPDDDAFGGADVFRQRPDEALEPGERLLVRRRFAYDVVPRAEGVLRVPEIRVPYLDPATGTYAVAQAGAVEVPVGPRAAPDARAGEDVAPGPRARAGRDAPTWRRWALTVVAVAALVALRFAWTRRRLRDAAAREGLSAAREARDRGDPDAEAAALARGLRGALARHVEGAATLEADALLARCDSPAAENAARLLARVERARFDPRAEPPEREAVERAIGAL